MTDHIIITIGRQFGSGGHEIGNRLATKLDIPLYDHNLVRMAAEKLGISGDTAEAVDETALNSFLSGYVYAPGDYNPYMNTMDYVQPLSAQMYMAQSAIIRELCGRSSCVVIGRCADYILQDNPNCINVFICADKDDRIKRISELYNLSEKKAADRIKKIDRERRYYYESNTGEEWGRIESHQMLLNVSRMGMDRIVDMLVGLYRAMEGGTD